MVEIAATAFRMHIIGSRDGPSMKPRAALGNALPSFEPAFPDHIVAIHLTHIDIDVAPPLIASHALYLLEKLKMNGAGQIGPTAPDTARLGRR